MCVCVLGVLIFLGVIQLFALLCTVLVWMGLHVQERNRETVNQERTHTDSHRDSPQFRTMFSCLECKSSNSIHSRLVTKFTQQNFRAYEQWL